MDSFFSIPSHPRSLFSSNIKLANDTSAHQGVHSLPIYEPTFSDTRSTTSFDVWFVNLRKHNELCLIQRAL